MPPLNVLVTGAASGIGKASANRLTAEGHAVAALDLSQPAVEAAIGGGGERRLAVGGDVSNAQDCQRAVDLAVERFGHLDGVLHWAACHSSKAWDELTADEMNRVLSVNVTGAFLIAQAAGKHMARRRQGAIVLTASGSVIIGASGGASGQGGPAYVSSKAAMTGLVRSLARGLGPSGVRVCGIAPGVTETPMIGSYSAEQKAAAASRFALGRIGQPEDIADVGAFLISDAARFITGEIIIVNGGAAFG